MAARKGITALALSILLMLSGLTQAQTTKEDDEVERIVKEVFESREFSRIAARAGVDACIAEAYRMLPAGRQDP